MNIPKEQNKNDQINVTIEYGKDKKMKVIKTPINDTKKNNIINHNYDYSNINDKYNNTSDCYLMNNEDGINLYLNYYKKNFLKFQENNLYNVYELKDIEKKMELAILEIMNLINIQYDYAYHFLKAYNFNSNDLLENWFNNSKKVLTKLKLSHLKEEDILNNNNNNNIDEPMIKQKKNNLYIIVNKKNLFAILLLNSVMLNNNNVICKCGYHFCFERLHEFHRPLLCSYIKKWYELENNDDHNMKWIHAYTKMCPNCNKPIEKNSGCMNVKCICGYSFCWLCLDNWKNHKGGFYKCNKYLEHNSKYNEQKKQKKKTDKKKDDTVKTYDDEKEDTDKTHDNDNIQNNREEKRNSHLILNRYNHFKSRFNAHQYAENFSIHTQLLFLYNFCKNYNIHLHKMKFFEDAIIQIIKCRKILKWSYTYAYFSNWKSDNQKHLFEYHQGELEKNLDILQTKTEDINLTQFKNNTDNDTVRDIQQLTQMIDIFFKNICEFMENNFV
ncbi:IBR domain-containing protein [Plasmodium falciparum RAJ116]|uniref:RBR-type E3 ubiquitin transferase n=1 Tax=Plasmodium falciparum RAJ116 TaxID=580058 RepID=A0A0L0CXU7_PLAFA|nr:IBR domain-containing protein [Plasmodium falciparum RAJ116]